MEKETTPAQRKAYIEQQRQAREKYGQGPNKRIFGDMSFINRKGNIVIPSREDFQSTVAKKDKDNAHGYGVPVHLDKQGRVVEDETGIVRMPIYVGRDGRIYDSPTDASKAEAKGYKSYTFHGKKLVPLAADDKGIMPFRYVGKNGELYDSPTDARKYGSKSVAKDSKNPARTAQSGRLEKSLAIIGILAGIFFLSPSMTGNAIANMTNSTSSFLGAGLFIVGLVAGLFWMKSRKK